MTTETTLYRFSIEIYFHSDMHTDITHVCTLEFEHSPWVDEMQCNLRFWIMKFQKEITNKTMRSQSKCWIQRLCNTATIGEPTERGMCYWQNTGGRHFLSSLVSALSCFKTEWSRIPIGIWQACHTTLWYCIGWSRKRLLRRRRINTRLPLCMTRN